MVEWVYVDYIRLSVFGKRCFLETVFLTPAKQVVWTKNGENDDFTFYPLTKKGGVCSSDRPMKMTNMTSDTT